MSATFTIPNSVNPTQPPRLLDQVRQAALQHYGRNEPADRFVDWLRRFILFHGKRHPRELDVASAGAFLKHLVQSEKDPLNAAEQAHEAILFLYDNVLHMPLGELLIPQPPRLLDRLRYALRVRHASPRTEECYSSWVRSLYSLSFHAPPKHHGRSRDRDVPHRSGGEWPRLGEHAKPGINR